MAKNSALSTGRHSQRRTMRPSSESDDGGIGCLLSLSPLLIALGSEDGSTVDGCGTGSAEEEEVEEADAAALLALAEAAEAEALASELGERSSFRTSKF